MTNPYLAAARDELLEAAGNLEAAARDLESLEAGGALFTRDEIRRLARAGALFREIAAGLRDRANDRPAARHNVSTRKILRLVHARPAETLGRRRTGSARSPAAETMAPAIRDPQPFHSPPTGPGQADASSSRPGPAGGESFAAWYARQATVDPPALPARSLGAVDGAAPSSRRRRPWWRPW